ncbi:MAG: hypothetical protein H6573_05550 [Lewinellaceae bacterium]|nr:hypothetical protein [Phaeodactylibacter sp.]MCB0612717.1 hypothetical protein [Phaeodactylibacter sp.]MCB9346967.1 hypothetical protein [Lewinellaceae bacterium]
MSMNFEFHSEGFEKHSCQGRREGEWLIFECPECSYVRKWNPESNEMNLIDSGDENALHSGMFEPVGLQMSKLNPN